MRTFAAVLLAAFMVDSGLVQAQTIVQPNGATQVSQLGAESPLGQSFVATMNGAVVALGVRSMNSVTATLRIYLGPVGSGVPNVIGSPLYTQANVNLTAAGGTGSAFGFSNIALATPFPVVAGQSYTFMLTAANPFSLAAQFGNAYPDGDFISIYGAIPFAGLGLDAAFQVFEVAPATVTSVGVPVPGNYVTATPLTFTVSWSEPVTVTGTPQLALTVGAVTRNAAYVSGSGTASLTFTYTVAGADQDLDGIAVNTLDLNGGTITNSSLNSDTTLNGVGATTGILVNAAYTVMPSVGPNGTIAPNTAQVVAHGGSQLFTATPNAGYTTSWAGTTCAGTPSGNTFNAGPITGNCTVAASFTQNTYTVTPNAGANGTISPNAAQVIAHGGSQLFTATPSPGYMTAWSSTCPGTPSGNTFNAGPITASCGVTATFSSAAVTSYTAPSATGSGTITAAFTGTGGPTCTYAVSQFIPVAGHAASPPAGSAPANIAFPHGLFDFRTTLCTPVPGAAITMTITYPAALLPGSQYWKYGPTPTDASPHWYILPAVISGNTVTFTITDGGLGDDDLTANGTIVDQGGPGVGVGGTIQTPTMSEWMLLVMASLILLLGLRRRRAGP